MEPVFTVHVVSDKPESLGGYNGFGAGREIEKKNVPIVTGQEEICFAMDMWDATVIAADGFIQDSEGRTVGIFLHSYYKKQKEENGRYELFPGQTLTIEVPTAELDYVGEVYDTAIFSFTLMTIVH